MAKKEKGYLAGLSDEMVAAAKAYLFEMEGPVSPELQRGTDFHKSIAKAPKGAQPTLYAVASKWLEQHMPIGAKSVSRPFDEADNKQPWWMYSPTGEQKDISAEGAWYAKQAGMSRQDVIDQSRPIYRGDPIPAEQQLPSVNYLQEDRNLLPPAPVTPGSSPAEQETAQAGMAEVET